MNDHRHVVISGSVRDIFAHRFVLRTESGPVLADLGPEGVVEIGLAVGDEVEIEGERKLSEIRVSRLLRGTRSFDLGHHGKGRHDDADPDEEDEADPEAALASARAAGLVPLGQPRRKHKHFEVLARDAEGQLFELHIRLDGREKKRKPVEEDDRKWSDAVKDEP